MNRTASAPRRKRGRGLGLWQLLLVLGFLVLVWFSFGQNVLSTQKQTGPPEKLGALALISKVEGPEALAQINKLHGTDINLISAYIAEYARENERVTVWVGRAGSEDAAMELTQRMVKGIERGGSGFGNLQRLTIAGQEVFQVGGSGGRHFFYNPRELMERVVWLTVEADNEMPILEMAVKTF